MWMFVFTAVVVRVTQVSLTGSDNCMSYKGHPRSTVWCRHFHHHQVSVLLWTENVAQWMKFCHYLRFFVARIVRSLLWCCCFGIGNGIQLVEYAAQFVWDHYLSLVNTGIWPLKLQCCARVSFLKFDLAGFVLAPALARFAANLAEHLIHCWFSHKWAPCAGKRHWFDSDCSCLCWEHISVLQGICSRDLIMREIWSYKLAMLDGLLETGKVQNFQTSLLFSNIAQEVKDSARIWSEPDFGQIWKKAGFLMEPDLEPNFRTTIMVLTRLHIINPKFCSLTLTSLTPSTTAAVIPKLTVTITSDPSD